MPFQLSKEYVQAIVDPFTQGDMSGFLDDFHPEVHWVIADPVYDSTSLSGTYVSYVPTITSYQLKRAQNLQEWATKVGASLRDKLHDGGRARSISSMSLVTKQLCRYPALVLKRMEGHITTGTYNKMSRY
jgi:hypothetical protein